MSWVFRNLFEAGVEAHVNGYHVLAPLISVYFSLGRETA